MAGGYARSLGAACVNRASQQIFPRVPRDAQGPSWDLQSFRDWKAQTLAEPRGLRRNSHASVGKYRPRALGCGVRISCAIAKHSKEVVGPDGQKSDSPAADEGKGEVV